MIPAGRVALALMLAAPALQNPPPPAAQDPLARPMALVVPGMAGVQVDRDRPYRDGPGAPRLDVYRSGVNGPAPVIVFVPGGPSPKGARVRDWGVFTSYGRAAAAQGFVGVTIEHGYSGLQELPAASANVAAAAGWVRSHAAEIGADADRVVIWGFSGAGALLAPMIANPPAGLRALVLFYAGLDLPPDTLAARPELGAYSAVAALKARSAWTIPLVVARAGRDDARLNEAMERFVARALQLQAPLDLLVHPAGRHGFDVVDHDERSRDIIARAFQVVAQATALRP